MPSNKPSFNPAEYTCEDDISTTLYNPLDDTVMTNKKILIKLLNGYMYLEYEKHKAKAYLPLHHHTANGCRDHMRLGNDTVEAYSDKNAEAYSDKNAVRRANICCTPPPLPLSPPLIDCCAFL